ncbi:hypothetical protein MHU86_13558 [Fragilaria crotonensis]|nr:hypothetical protein MHU86_13558 [Fragilaria crotonensis]
MKEEDREKFKESMVKEVTDQANNVNFTIIPKSEAPKGQTILPAVWQMKRKRDAKDGSAIKKYKARLNIDGARMKRAPSSFSVEATQYEPSPYKRIWRESRKHLTKGKGVLDTFVRVCHDI